MTSVGEDNQLVVTVFGANDPKPDEKDYQVAFGVGKELAQLGYTIANGGYGGTMEASARGAKSAGGKTIGVPCRIFSPQCNEYIDSVILTDSLVDRIQKLIELGTAGFVVLRGATGTLAELAWVWELTCKGFMQGKKPIVCIGEFWVPLLDMMVLVRPASAQFVTLIDSPEELPKFFTR